MKFFLEIFISKSGSNKKFQRQTAGCNRGTAEKTPINIDAKEIFLTDNDGNTENKSLRSNKSNLRRGRSKKSGATKSPQGPPRQTPSDKSKSPTTSADILVKSYLNNKNKHQNSKNKSLKDIVSYLAGNSVGAPSSILNMTTDKGPPSVTDKGPTGETHKSGKKVLSISMDHNYSIREKDFLETGKGLSNGSGNHNDNQNNYSVVINQIFNRTKKHADQNENFKSFGTVEGGKEAMPLNSWDSGGTDGWGEKRETSTNVDTSYIANLSRDSSYFYSSERNRLDVMVNQTQYDQKYFVVDHKNRLMRKINDMDMKKKYSKGEKNVFGLGFEAEDQV